MMVSFSSILVYFLNKIGQIWSILVNFVVYQGHENIVKVDFYSKVHYFNIKSNSFLLKMKFLKQNSRLFGRKWLLFSEIFVVNCT